MMTLRAVRDVRELERERTESAPALVFPLESSIIELVMGGAARRLDRASFALVPARAPYAMSAESTVVSVVVLLVGTEEHRAAKREYEPDFVPAVFDAIVSRPRVLARTRWVDEIVQRYLFERTVCERHDSQAARFLETEITKELFFLGKEQLEEKARASVVEEERDLVRKARAWLESRLFEPLRMAELARHCHASESTLLRAFRQGVGVPPTVYVRNRRLEEALLLLESGRYNVSEVATRVGYGSVSAFTVALGRRFLSSPSEVLPKTGPRLPPHGKPPERRRRTTK